MILKNRHWKQGRWWSRVKFIYTRITLNRFTTWYFLFALLTCLALVVLQGVAFADNSKAIHMIEEKHPPLPLDNGMCPPPMNCTSTSNHEKRSILRLDDLSKIHNRDNGDVKPSGHGPSNHTGIGKKFNRSCEKSMFALGFKLNLERREDVVIIVFNVWLLSLSFVTIVYESLPHLGASLVGHVLGTSWATYRLASHGNPEKFIVKNCKFDPWIIGRAHDINIAILVVNLLALLTLAFLSFKLCKIYASQSFGRVGSSATISKVYKIVLVFSACLQLAAFFTLASASLWFDRVDAGLSSFPADPMQLYLVACIITILLAFPWVILGWVSVRKEGRRRFLVFSHISVSLIVISSLKFFSHEYQSSFKIWSFFATITVIAFVLVVTTTVLGVWCRVNFGRGLYQYLEAIDALDDMNFTPETFRNDNEKDNTYRTTRDYIDEKQIRQIITEYIKQPQVAHEPTSKSRRGLSIYSEKVGTPLKLSSTPSLFGDRDGAAAETGHRVQRTNPSGRDHSNPRAEGYKQRVMSFKSTSMASPLSKRSRDLTPSSHSSFTSPMSPSMFKPPPTSISPSRGHLPQASESLAKQSYTKGLAFIDMS